MSTNRAPGAPYGPNCPKMLILGQENQYLEDGYAHHRRGGNFAAL
jgi:hypothetical protein